MSAPTIYDRREAGLSPADPYCFGRLGDVDYVTIHHSAGPRAATHSVCRELNRRYQAQHRAQGWGDIGYHFCLDDLGRVYRLRPSDAKGAHVGGHNTGNIGIMLHGNYEQDELTKAQRETLRWLFRGGFAVLFGEQESGIRDVRGHRDWSGHTSNACPGDNLYRHLRWLKSVETY